MSIFVSVVGTQVMGTLNPLLALLDEGIQVEKVLLMYTKKSKEYMERLVPWIKKHYPGLKIKTLPINLTIDVEKLIRQSEGKNIIYNISGGLNFQIAKFLYDYYINRGKLDIKAVYSEMETTWLYDLETEDKQELCLKTNLKPIEILKLQNVPYKLTRFKNGKIIYFLEKKIQPLCIGDIEFHHVISKNNYLYFYRFELHYKLSKIRRVISTIKDRSTIGELKSFKVIVFTDDNLVRRRYKSEGEGIFEVFPLSKIKEIFEIPYNKNEIHEKITTKLEKPPSITSSTGKYLYTILSRDLLVTLKTILTHKCENLCLISTEEEEIKNIAKNIVRYGKKYNLYKSGAKIFLTDFSSSNVLRMSSFGNGEAIVNITPGTKSQTTMLTAWALKNRAKIFSINNATNEAVSLDGEERIPVSLPDPHVLLILKGELFEEGKSLLKYYKKYNGLEKCINGSLNKFYELIEREKNTGIIVSTSEMRNLLSCKHLKPGFYFEVISAQVLEHSGVENVAISVRTHWGNQYYTCKSEIDICGIYNNHYFIYSVKITGARENDIKEIKAQSIAFGRFSIPVLIALRYREDYKIQDGVLVIGWKTLFNPLELKEAHHYAIKSKMKITE